MTTPNTTTTDGGPAKDEDGNTAHHYYAKGVMWFLIWLGFGGCCWMSKDQDKPLFAIKTEAARAQGGAK